MRKGSSWSIARSARANSRSGTNHSSHLENTLSAFDSVVKALADRVWRTAGGVRSMTLSAAGGARLLAAAAGLCALGLLAPAAAQGPSLAMLGTLDDGQWELRFRDGRPSKRICVRSGLELIQIQHRGTPCSRFVVEDGTTAVTVQYTCRGDGYGRTTLRKENSHLVQLDSQGIAGGLPFEFSAEARRAGACR